MSRREIRPGMLCLVIGSIRPESPNIGKIATVLRKITRGEWVNKDLLFVGQTDVWLLEGEGLCVQQPHRETWENKGGVGLAQDHHLMPIVPPDQQLQHTSIKKLKVPHDARELTTTT